MLNTILNYMINHPMLSIAVVGGFLGTVVTYIAPNFTRNNLIADEWFCAGNVGITVFIHANWAHYIGNMIFAVPAILIGEHLYGNTILIAFTAVSAITTGLSCWIFKHCCCGFSGEAYGLVAMCCAYGLHWYGIAIIALITVIEIVQAIGDKSNTSHTAHFIGLVAGFGLGYFLM